MASRGKVLVVEDDHLTGEVIDIRLKRLGFDVVFATTLEAGLALAESEKPGLILTDLKLQHDPEAGLGLIQRLRANPATAGIPIVIHSIFVSYRADLKISLPSVDGYLPKPFKLAQLVELLAVHFKSEAALPGYEGP